MRHDPYIGADQDVSVPKQLQGTRAALFYILSAKPSPVEQSGAAQPKVIKGERIPVRPIKAPFAAKERPLQAAPGEDHFTFKF